MRVGIFDVNVDTLAWTLVENVEGFLLAISFTAGLYLNVSNFISIIAGLDIVARITKNLKYESNLLI